jgi:uncharacterized membrane protein YjgN (DUF898 family)
LESVTLHHFSAAGVTKTSVNIFILCNVLNGPTVAAIYAMVIYKQRKWQRQNATAGQVDASTKKFLAAQARITVMLTKLVIVYCVLVSR